MFHVSLGFAAFTKAVRRLKECLIFNENKVFIFRFHCVSADFLQLQSREYVV